MYIPDKINIVGRGNRVMVFSADEGHGGEPPLQVANVQLHWDELKGLLTWIEYGTRIQPFGEEHSHIVTRNYAANRVTFDLQRSPVDAKE